MKIRIFYIFVVTFTAILFSGCAANTPQPKVEKYPRKPAVSDERKSGPAMLFYEAAEEDADPNNVIVIPPEEKKDTQ